MNNKNKKVGVIRNNTHLIWLVRPKSSFVYNKYKIYEWDEELMFWDEIKHPTGKNLIIKKYNLNF